MAKQVKVLAGKFSNLRKGRTNSGSFDLHCGRHVIPTPTPTGVNKSMAR